MSLVFQLSLTTCQGFGQIHNYIPKPKGIEYSWWTARLTLEGALVELLFSWGSAAVAIVFYEMCWDFWSAYNSFWLHFACQSLSVAESLSRWHGDEELGGFSQLQLSVKAQTGRQVAADQAASQANNQTTKQPNNQPVDHWYIDKWR